MTTKLILDPGLFEIDSSTSRSDQEIHFRYLLKNINFVSEHFNAALDTYDGAPYYGLFCNADDYSPPPITKSGTIRDNFVTVRKALQKMIRTGEYIEISNISNELDCPIEFESDTVSEMPFKHYLQAILTKTGDATSTTPFLLLSMRNIRSSPKIEIDVGDERIAIISVGNPATDCNGIIAYFLCEATDKHGIFPQKNACLALNDDFMEKTILDSYDKLNLYKKYGSETASRNGYIKKDDLSRKNPRYCVFEHRLRSYYLSIDLEHGGLEVFRHHGQQNPHLGEYDFACTFIKGPDPQTHKINA